MDTDTGMEQQDSVSQRLRQRAAESILSGTRWLSAKEVGANASAGSGDPDCLAALWTRQGRLFGIERSGLACYPLYAFDDSGQPLPVVEELLLVLSGHSPLSIAAWLESTSSMLGGRRPREIIRSDPAAVLAAAQDHVAGVQHG